MKNLSKTYSNGVKALQDVSITIGKGMFGLPEQNGAGKSTLMCSIATFQDADSGTIHFNDIDAAKEPEKQRKRLGYLPQDFSVYPNVTAEELLADIADMMGIVQKGERKDTVEALLQKVNLHDAKSKKLDGYSGGMKQQFGIAQALIGNPDLIVVNELTAGLDPMERNRCYNLLSELGENAVIILSTHILEDVSTLCTDMAIIGNGKVVLTGKPKEVEESLRGKRYEVPISKEQLPDYQRNYKVISQRFFAGKMMITVLADDVSSGELNAKAPSLEDAYFKILSEN
ncbi:MAG: ATP-binding cassette domain-containing protein [Bacteroidota bacterium]